jgi:RNA polymerase sigma-70 factor, ECF subfamily
MFAHKLKLCQTVSAHPEQPSKPIEENVAKSDDPSSEWCKLTAQLKAGEDTGREQLYKLFSRCIRYYLSFQFAPQELEHRIHDMIAVVVDAIQRGDLQDSELLVPFIRSVARKHLQIYIAQTDQNDCSPTDLGSGVAVVAGQENPKVVAVMKQKVALMTTVLSCLSQRDLDILDRFYLQEQRYEHFCGDMCVTETQFRLLKSRLKIKFKDLNRKFASNINAEYSNAASHTSPDR